MGRVIAGMALLLGLGCGGCATTTGLHEAAKAGSLQAVATLLRQNPRSIAERDNIGGTALHVAAAYGHREIVELLLAKGADVNDSANDLQVTPLHLAAGSGQRDTVELLLANRANVHAKNMFGQAPLDVAECRGKTRVAALLRERASKTEKLAMAGGKDRDRPSPCEVTPNGAVESTVEASLVALARLWVSPHTCLVKRTTFFTVASIARSGEP